MSDLKAEAVRLWRSAPPRGSVDGGGGWELAVVVSHPEGLVIENLFIDVVFILAVLDSVGVRVDLRLHHHGGGYHFTVQDNRKYNQLIEMQITVKWEAEQLFVGSSFSSNKTWWLIDKMNEKQIF